MSAVSARADQIRARVEDIRISLRERVRALQERVPLISELGLLGYPTNFPILEEVRARGVIGAIRGRVSRAPMIYRQTTPRMSPQTSTKVSPQTAPKAVSPQTTPAKSLSPQVSKEASPQKAVRADIVDYKEMAVEAEPARPVNKREISIAI